MYIKASYSSLFYTIKHKTTTKDLFFIALSINIVH